MIKLLKLLDYILNMLKILSNFCFEVLSALDILFGFIL